jgi:hypothetical protein
VFPKEVSSLCFLLESSMALKAVNPSRFAYLRLSSLKESISSFDMLHLFFVFLGLLNVKSKLSSSFLIITGVSLLRLLIELSMD